MATQPLVDPYLTPFLERMPASSRDLVLVNSTRIRYRAGVIAYHHGDPDRAEILITGFARLYLASSEGRQATVRYLHPGELMGSLLIMRGVFAGSMQMVTDSSVIRLDIVGARGQIASVRGAHGLSAARVIEELHSHSKLQAVVAAARLGLIDL